jgi:aminopeptidase N
VPPTPNESRKRLMHIPLTFGLVGRNGHDAAYASVEGAAVENGVIHIRKRRHQIRFGGFPQRPVVSLNRGFSAPITLSVAQKNEDRMFLARHDDDLYCRWQALNTLFTDALIAASRQCRGGKAPKFSAGTIALAGAIAGDDTLEPAYRALALTLPGEADIAREIGSNIDPDAVFKAREALVAAIAEANGDAFAEIYKGLSDNAPFSPDAANAGRRALRNALLDYLSAGRGPARAANQYKTATNMTDRAAALTVLAHRHAGSDEASAALASFESRYGADPLVMDKWFMIQATVPGPGAVESVAALMEHKGFSIANPNRVRSLIGTFATANQTGFNRRDGAGYRLFGETVLKVEKRNPQVAARLATALRSWRSFEPGRQEQARLVLAGIVATPGLSAVLRDIVERTLA